MKEFVFISPAECGRMTKILKDTEGNYSTSIAFCKSLICPTCLEMAKANLSRNINGYVLQYGLEYMLTLTTSLFDNDSELKKWFSSISLKINSFYDYEFFKSKKSSLKVMKEGSEDDKKEYYNNWKLKVIHDEAVFNMIVYGKYRGYNILYNLFIYLRKMQEDDKSFVGNLLNKYNEELSSREIRNYKKVFKHKIKKVIEMEKGEMADIFHNNFSFFKVLFYDYIECKDILKKQFSDLQNKYKDCFCGIFDKTFKYIRVTEFQKFKDVEGKRRPHYHLISNLYVFNIFCLEGKQEHSNIWDNGYVSKFLEEKNEDCEGNSAEYIIKYITKDTMDYLKGGKDSADVGRILGSSNGISVSLTANNMEDRGYKLVDTVFGLSNRMEDKFGSKTELMETIVDRDDFESKHVIEMRSHDLFVISKIEEVLKCQELDKYEKYEALSKIGTLDNNRRKIGYDNLFLKSFFDYKASISNMPDVFKLRKLDYVDYGVLDNYQRYALDVAMNNDMCFITGGAGSGKTQVIKQICANYPTEDICCVSFSGKAVSVMKERIDCENVTFMTIHKFIKAVISKGLNTCFYTRNNSRKFSILIVDEVSMLSTELLGLLLEANGAFKTVFVGDINQLPPVSVTNCLEYLPQLVPTVKLISNHRSNIFLGKVADSVLDCRVDLIPSNIVLNKEPNYKKFVDNGYQILVSSNRKKKSILKEILKDKTDIVLNNYKKFDIGDNVMLTLNDYDKDINNGDIYKIVDYKPLETVFLVNNKGKNIELSYFEFCNYVEPSQCITIHKSQGSEYSKVLLVLDKQQALRSFNLLYTGVTRAKEELLIWDCCMNENDGVTQKAFESFAELPKTEYKFNDYKCCFESLINQFRELGVVS